MITAALKVFEKKKVKPAFEMFDQDNSGNIDKKELQKLSSDLGNEIAEEKLDEALKDLDMNGDGVIDYSEFKRWYFSGMKPYRPGRKGFYKAISSIKQFASLSKNAKLINFMKDPANRETTT
jgi:hypothetical protein